MNGIKNAKFPRLWKIELDQLLLQYHYLVPGMVKTYFWQEDTTTYIQEFTQY